MNIECVICKRLITPLNVENVFCTPCGHVFHFSCISYWLGRSNSCPHCRTEVSQSTLNKVNFNSSKGLLSENSAILQNLVEDLELKFQLKEIALNSNVSKVSSLDKEIYKIQREIVKIESKIVSKICPNLDSKKLFKLFLEDKRLMNVRGDELQRIKNKSELKELKACTKIKSQREVIHYLNQDIFSMIKGRQFLEGIIQAVISFIQVQISKNMKNELSERLRLYEDKDNKIIEEKDSAEIIISTENNRKRKSQRLLEKALNNSFIAKKKKIE